MRVEKTHNSTARSGSRRDRHGDVVARRARKSATCRKTFTRTLRQIDLALLVRRETPRLCRGGSKSLTAPAVCFSIQVPVPLALRLGACDFDFGSRQGPL